MTLQEAIETLILHQEWRMGSDEVGMLPPSDITEAIQKILEYHSELPKNNDVREDDVEKLAEEEFDNLNRPIRSGIDKWSYIIGFKEAKENTYTEEQIREALSKSISTLVGQELNLGQLKELIIQSLKQNKQ